VEDADMCVLGPV